MIVISASTPPQLANRSYPGYSFLLGEMTRLIQKSHGEGVSLELGEGACRTVIWILPLPVKACTRVKKAAEILQLYAEDPPETSSLVIPFQTGWSHSWGEIQTGTSFVLVANKLGSSVLNSVNLDGDDEFKGHDVGGGRAKGRFQAFGEERNRPRYLDESSSIAQWRVLRVFLLLFFLCGIISFLALSGDGTRSGHGEEESNPIMVEKEPYIRYPIHGSGSIGPKYQLRIQWHNASEWRHTHPHDNGEWAFRIDDQALVPAHLYDAAEDAYQQWFRARYPHMAQLVDERDYIRPAWLGSRDVAVEWDSTFHNAHCVLALRRYFWAKESGRHVCPRDIDPGHIGHCLDALDAAMFTPGPMTEHEPKRYMYWQTKWCFGGN
ncbi:hypothetical protein B0H66DRAFT_644634 [Apodospora peruviana]|uniref:Uncharacterized protein n=1 Tax=Apodospora peruviana TaxID=516989 RepID=A0AAE0HT68_9PEZI|nr:hypothetical protein B0H66DRAFT_644634 [Apodospora peruviana]